MSILGRHNAHLTAIQAPDTSLTVKWSGDADANLVETLVEAEGQQSAIWRSYLAIPSNLDVDVQPGDLVLFTKDGETSTSTYEIRDVIKRPLFGVIRLHFADR